MKMLALMSSLLLSFTASANLARKTGHWRTERPITIEVSGANENQLSCIERTLKDITDIIPIRFSFYQKGDPSTPRRVNVSLQVKNLIGYAGSSHVGNYFFLREQMKLDLSVFSCNRYDRRVILHEFGHLLGLEHEHQHPDTPSYITQDLLSGGSSSQSFLIPFRPSKTNRMIVTSYDPDSVMHYISYRYNTGGYELSQGDIHILKMIYDK